MQTCSVFPAAINPEALGAPSSSALTFGEIKSQDFGTAEVFQRVSQRYDVHRASQTVVPGNTYAPALGSPEFSKYLMCF